MHDMYERFRITFNNYLTKLDDLKESYDQFIIAHILYKMKNFINLEKDNIISNGSVTN